MAKPESQSDYEMLRRGVFEAMSPAIEHCGLHMLTDTSTPEMIVLAMKSAAQLLLMKSEYTDGLERSNEKVYSENKHLFEQLQALTEAKETLAVENVRIAANAKARVTAELEEKERLKKKLSTAAFNQENMERELKDCKDLLKKHDVKFQKNAAELAEERAERKREIAELKKKIDEQDRINAELKAELSDVKKQLPTSPQYTKLASDHAVLFMAQLSNALADRIATLLQIARGKDVYLSNFLDMTDSFISDLTKKFPRLVEAAELLRRKCKGRTGIAHPELVPSATNLDEHKQVMNLSEDTVDALDEAIACLAYLNSLSTPAREPDDMSTPKEN